MYLKQMLLLKDLCRPVHILSELNLWHAHHFSAATRNFKAEILLIGCRAGTYRGNSWQIIR